MQPSSWPSRFRLIIVGGNRQRLQVDRDKAAFIWRLGRGEKREGLAKFANCPDLSFALGVGSSLLR